MNKLNFYLLIFIYLIKLVNSYNVSYDHRSLIIDGERKLLLSGSVHYVRSTPSYWPIILNQSKEAGIDVIETYVFWNLHEPTPGVYNFEGNANISLFLDYCIEAGLYVNLRIGPYICGEYNYGGLPVWLRNIDGMVFRDYNEPFMTQMSRWMIFITDYLRPYFAVNGGPIIMAQVENEYGWLEEEYGVSGQQYAQWAIEFAMSLDIGVPWIMCAQDNIEQAINTCNGFYCHEWIQPHWNTFPNQPAFYTENWPGWFQNWGEAIPHRPVQDVLYSVCRWFAYGGSLMNYYMWYGGTTFGRQTGGPYIIQSYDYDVAIDEYGFPYEPKYSQSQALHEILHKYSNFLLDNDVPLPISLNPITEVSIYSIGNNSLVFLTNFGNGTSPETIIFQSSKYQLNPWSVKILFNSQEIFDTSYIPQLPQPLDIQTIVDFNSPDIMDNFEFWSELIGNYQENIILNAVPLEQINITQDQSDYLAYQIFISNDLIETENELVLTNTDDLVHVFINGKTYIGFYHGPNFTVNYQINSSDSTNGGYNLTIITETVGLMNYGAHMELYNRGITGQVYLNQINITSYSQQWLMKPCLTGEDLKIYLPDMYNSVSWQSLYSDSGVGPDTNTLPFTWFTVNINNLGNYIDPSISVQAFALNMTGTGKGLIYVNGYFVGRYWLLTAEYPGCQNCDVYPGGPYTSTMCRSGCGQPSQSLYHVPIDWLNFKVDTITIFEEFPNINPTQISVVQLKK